MSGFAVDWVWTLERPRHTERLVLAILASHARGDGVCWPGEGLIAQEAAIVGTSARRVVRRAIRGLEAAGEIEAHPAMLRVRRITVYRLAWPGRRPVDLSDYDWTLLRPVTADRPFVHDPPARPELVLHRGGLDSGGAA